jgi:hypothetical protein
LSGSLRSNYGQRQDTFPAQRPQNHPSTFHFVRLPLLFSSIKLFTFNPQRTKRHTTMLRKLPIFLLALSLAACTAQESETEVTETTTEQEMPSTTTETTEPMQTGFIHTVFFYTPEGQTAEELAALEAGIRTLGEIPSVQEFYVGPAAGTPRDVVDNSYGVALIVHFADKAGHDLYQDHPIHLKFIEDHQDKWERVQVYDTLPR